MSTSNTGIPAVLMRGGLARGAIFNPSDLPTHGPSRDSVLLKSMGSPDRLGAQLDGLGSGTTSTSKCALVQKSSRQDSDVDYLFAQVMLDSAIVNWTRSCGNLAAAVALYSVQEGLMKKTDEAWQHLRIWQENRGEHIAASVHESTGEVALTFFGKKSTSVFAAFGPSFTLRVEDLGLIEVSVVDATNQIVFVDADAVGKGQVTTLELSERLQRIQRAVGTMLGRDPERPNIRAVIVEGSGEPDSDVILTAMSGARLHEGLPLTSAICGAVAAQFGETVVGRACGSPQGRIRIGHQSGTTTVSVSVAQDAFVSASVELTARRIMTGVVHV